MEELTRRNIRYICFRIQTALGGGAKIDKDENGIMQYAEDIKKHMESQEDFGGWDRFGKTWDADDKSPLVIVARTSSIQSQWNTILKEEVKELPVEKEKKFLTNKLSEKVQETKKEQQAAPEVVAETKQVKNDLQETVQENIKQSGKTSFWDKLK